MTRPDDELVRRYQEASAQEEARPGTHVRDAVRAHAQMVAAAAAATAASTATAGRSRAAANQSRWKISALATVALVGLTGLLMLQFERGTPEERDIAFGQRRAHTPAPSPSVVTDVPAVQEAAPAAPAPATRPAPATAPVRDLARPPPGSAAQQPAQAAPAGVRPSANATPPTPPAPRAPAAAPTARSRPAPGDSESLARPDAGGALSGFPASPPAALRSQIPSAAPGPGPEPTPAPAPSSHEAPRAETRERLAMEEKSASRAMTTPRPAPYPAAPSQQEPPVVTRSLPGGNAASSDAAAAAPQVQKTLDPTLPRALRDAARVGNAREVERLIGQGAPLDGRDTAGRTALMIAAINGHIAAVQKLLALGAQTTLVDGDGLTAAQHARRWGYGTIADLIDAAR